MSERRAELVRAIPSEKEEDEVNYELTRRYRMAVLWTAVA
jgi:hypothetical protein